MDGLYRGIGRQGGKIAPCRSTAERRGADGGRFVEKHDADPRGECRVMGLAEAQTGNIGEAVGRPGEARRQACFAALRHPDAPLIDLSQWNRVANSLSRRITRPRERAVVAFPARDRELEAGHDGNFDTGRPHRRIDQLPVALRAARWCQPYMTYLAGASLDQIEDSDDPELRKRAIRTAIVFVLGFTTVFTLLGATASALGQLCGNTWICSASLPGSSSS